jgi:Mitochondrial ATP synthase B chain precursor (ATP-synt_B)
MALPVLSNSNYRLYLYGFLIFCVASSKHLIIYNEETLVAISFFGFVYFIVSNFSTPIISLLDEKAELTLQDYQESVQNQYQGLVELREQFQALTLLGDAVSSFKGKTVQEFSSYDTESQIALLKKEKTLQNQEILKVLVLLKQGYFKVLQEKFAESLLVHVQSQIQNLSGKDKKKEKNLSKSKALLALNILSKEYGK